MSIYSEISKFGEFFNSIRKHESFLVVDLKLPVDWEVDTILSDLGNGVQQKINSKNTTQKLISFFSTFDEVGAEHLSNNISAIIKWNKDIEEKNNLLDVKMVELRKMFEENNVDSLRKLDFTFKENQLKLTDVEEANGLVTEGSDIGPEGDRNSQE